MKKVLLGACVATLAIAACVSSRGADKPSANDHSQWNGTWKLNVMASQRNSDDLTIARFYSESGYDAKTGSYGATPRGDMAYMTKNLSFEFACNGKPYPVQHPHEPEASVTCVQASDGSWTFTVSSKGKQISKCRHSISGDKKTMTVSCANTNAGGTQTNTEDVYMAYNVQSGFVGAWKKRPSATNPETVTFNIQGDAIRITTSTPKSAVDAKLNGAAVPLTGPGVPAGTTESVKFDSPSRLHTVLLTNGKDNYQAILDLNNQTIREGRWGSMVGNESLVWEKQ
jgi:hypothetical protein